MKLFAAELDFRPVAEEFDLPTSFPADVEREAELATDRFPDERRDLVDVPFVTIDPAGSMDLDQAVHIEAEPHPATGQTGWRVRYAIADVAAFITPGSALEAESIHRGQTMYLPDEPVRLHPTALSEGSASLLPDQIRPAVVWDIHVAPDGEVDTFTVYRARVRSVARFDYDEAEADMLAGTLHPAIAELPALGAARQRSDLRRHAINLRLPSVSVVTTTSDATPQRPAPSSVGDDRVYSLTVDPRGLMNDYNAELSLLAGMCAGQMMVAAGRGVLRTLPPASDKALAEFDAAATALGYDRAGRHVGELLAEVDASTPRGMAVMRDAQRLLRGAGYVPIGLTDAPGEPEIHAGIGGYYAHVTAPLRRLVDRFGTEICLAIAEERPVPDWVEETLPAVVEAMDSSSQKANKVDRACLNLTEAVVLHPWVGQNFSATVLHSGDSSAQVFLEQPPVIADCQGTPHEATTAVVTLITADPAIREVEFAWPAD